MRFAISLLAVSVLLVGFHPAQDSSAPDVVEKPFSEQGYLGLSVRDIPSGHTVVSWLFPGPLQGEGLAAPAADLSRPDLLVSVDGKAMSKEEFDAYIPSLAPGTEVTLAVRTSNRRGGTIPDEPDHADEVRTLTVTLESRDEWAGTIHRGRAHGGMVPVPWPRLLDFRGSANILGAAVVEHGLSAPLETLAAVFVDYLADNDDFHSLSAVRSPFVDPFGMPELEQRITAPTHLVSEDPFQTAEQMVDELLDLGGKEMLFWGGVGDIDLRRRMQWAAEAGTDQAPEGQQRAFAEKCLAFLRVPRSSFYISGDATKDHVEVMRHSMTLDWSDRLRGDLRKLALLATTSPEELTTPVAGFKVTTDPAACGGGVEGEITAWATLKEGRICVIGGEGPNRYDMAKVAVVIDPGGNDEYWASDLRFGGSAIIDLAGDDYYTGTPDQGPGSALLGASLIDDRAGNDRYEGELLSCGAAMFGISLLLDRGGNDIYTGTEWSIGAACYGAGLLFDLGSGNDQYLGDFLCEGVGGPRGLGCIIDENGRDLYRANGPTPSAYGTAAVYQSFSQGFGFGYRQYAAGGIGMISDLGGDDRYEAGEFAQGGAYYWGLGILHDAAGRDLYYGNRYGQGFGVHQAAGILADDAGDDTYWSMTAASQGAAWDIGVGLLIDREGNDSYQCDGLGQGGASMQAIAMLLDLAGTDRYIAKGGGIQGLSGGNSYHYHTTGAFSFSLLMDLGGAEDHYSTGRPNDAVSVQGEPNEADPKNSPLHGLVIDR
jgi:hypothetical protein